MTTKKEEPKSSKKGIIGNIKKNAVQSGVSLLAATGGFIAGNQIAKLNKKNDWKINAGLMLASGVAHAAINDGNNKVKALKNALLGIALYFGIKSLNNATAVAVSGLSGLPDNVKSIISKIVPTLGEVEDIQGAANSLTEAEAEILNGMFGEVDLSMLGDVGRIKNLAKRAPGSPAVPSQNKKGFDFSCTQMNGMGNVAIDSRTI